MGKNAVERTQGLMGPFYRACRASLPDQVTLRAQEENAGTGSKGRVSEQAWSHIPGDGCSGDRRTPPHLQ